MAYGFRGRESEQEIVFLEQLCMRLKVPLHIYTLNKADRVRLSSGNLQAVARDIRRTYFETLMINGTYLCLGHNLSDNCETFLLRLLSGSGLKGLSSMGSLSKICNYSGNVDSIEAPKNEEPAKAQGFILRPLLNTRRELLEQWLSLNSIEHCHDSSNSTDKYKRNQIRHHLIPLIQRIEPAALDVIDQSLKLMAVDSSFLEEEAEMACNKILKNEFAGGKSVACDSLRGLHRAISSRVIRSLIEGVGFSRGVRCSYLLTEEILAMVWSEKSTALSSIRKHIQIALFRNRIWVFPIGEVNKFSLVVNYSDQGLSVQKSEESGSPEVLNNNDIKIGNSVFSEQNSVINCQGCHWSFDVRICDDLPSLSMKIRNYSEPGLSPMVYVGRLNDDVFPLTIRAFNTGDRLVAVKEGISKKVSSILGERGVPQYLRELWPVMLSGNNIIWVGGFRCSTPCDLKEDQGPFFVVEISPLLKGL